MNNEKNERTPEKMTCKNLHPEVSIILNPRRRNTSLKKKSVLIKYQTCPQLETDTGGWSGRGWGGGWGGSYQILDLRSTN
jgi:hypothetical protein